MFEADNNCGLYIQRSMPFSTFRHIYAMEFHSSSLGIYHIFLGFRMHNVALAYMLSDISGSLSLSAQA